jgi:predicted AlkP superfamily pyrophosphatase or phosphodiesterase
VTRLLVWALPLFVIGCRSEPTTPEMGPVPAQLDAGAPQPKVAARRVVLVSIDGLRADMINALITPTLMALRAQGTSTLNARPDPGRIYTMPNHICMITGLPTEGAQGHGFTRNRGSEGTVHEAAGRVVQTTFDVVHRHGRRTALWVSKAKLGVLVNTVAKTTRAPDVVGVSDHDDDATLRGAMHGLRGPTPPAFALVHFAAPDQAGHEAGFDPKPGSAYRAAVQQTDARLAKLVAALPADTALIVTSDHGGHDDRHGDLDEPDDYVIPLLVVGGGAAPATDLYVLNARVRTEPARALTWGGEPVRNCEVGNLALRLLGLPPIPGSVYGGRFDLELRPSTH